MIVWVAEDGHIVIPPDIRRKLGLAAGQRLELLERDGGLVLRPVAPAPLLAARGRFRGSPLVDALMAKRKHKG